MKEDLLSGDSRSCPLYKLSVISDCNGRMQFWSSFGNRGQWPGGTDGMMEMNCLERISPPDS